MSPPILCLPPASGSRISAGRPPPSVIAKNPSAGVGVRPRSEQASAKNSPSCRRRSLPRSGPRRGSGGKRAIWVARASPPSSSQPRPVPPPAGGGCWPGLPRSHPEAWGLSPTHPTYTPPRGPLPPSTPMEVTNLFSSDYQNNGLDCLPTSVFHWQ